MKLFLRVCLCGFLAVGGGRQVSAQVKTDVSHRETLLAAMMAKVYAKSYRLREVQTSGGEGVALTITTTASYVAPDSYQATVETNLGGGGKGEALLIGGAAYGRAPSGAWVRKQADPQRIEAEFARLRNSILIDKLTKARDVAVKLIAREMLDGVVTNVYRYSYAGPPQLATTFHNEVWVGVSDGQPYKIEVESRTTHKGLKLSSKTTTTYFDYNADDIVIKAPM